MVSWYSLLSLLAECIVNSRAMDDFHAACDLCSNLLHQPEPVKLIMASLIQYVNC